MELATQTETLPRRPFLARYHSNCKICGADVWGKQSTWIRSKNTEKKGYVHLTCWETRDARETSDSNATLDASETIEPIVEPIIEKPVQSSDGAVIDMLGNALWSRFESRVKAIESNSDKLSSKLDSELASFRSDIEDLLNNQVKPTHVTLQTAESAEIKDLGIQHNQFPTLLKMVSARDHNGHRLNIWIAGPAGTGKSTAAEKVAAVLGLDFASTGALIESYKIFGFIVPGTGAYAPTPFRKIWENGGVFLFDDCDGSDPAVLVEMNNALANGGCTFPDGYVKRHADCALVLTANTWGLGATNDYVGRMKQDAAFLDRFVKLYWDIDEALELATSPDTIWTKRVQQVRANVKAKGIKVMVTPRASYYGAALLQAGMSRDEAEQAVLKASMTNDQWESVC